jgi:hypothetical protein
MLCNGDWQHVVEMLGGAEHLERTARACGAFQRARRVRSAQDLLRLCLAYGPSGLSLRSASAWASASGLAQLCDVSLLERLRKCDGWLEALVTELLARGGPRVVCARPIRIIDGSVVCKAGAKKRGGTGLWRLHATLEASAANGVGGFSHLILTDQRGGERFDRAPVIAGEIRIADRAYLQPDRIAAVLDGGGDVLVRAGWKNARWRDAQGAPFDIIALLSGAGAHGEGRDMIDAPISIARKAGPPVTGLRLIAIRKSPEATRISRDKVRKAAKKGGHKLQTGTLVAAEWILLVTSLDAENFSTEQIGALYRLRWRIEIAFKRLKSLVGYRQPPGKDPRLAKVFLLAHLLLALIADDAQHKLRESSPSAGA